MDIGFFIGISIAVAIGVYIGRNPHKLIFWTTAAVSLMGAWWLFKHGVILLSEIPTWAYLLAWIMLMAFFSIRETLKFARKTQELGFKKALRESKLTCVIKQSIKDTNWGWLGRFTLWLMAATAIYLLLHRLV